MTLKYISEVHSLFKEAELKENDRKVAVKAEELLGITSSNVIALILYKDGRQRGGHKMPRSHPIL